MISRTHLSMSVPTRITHFTDVNNELVAQQRTLIEGFENVSIVALEETLNRFQNFLIELNKKLGSLRKTVG